MRSRLVAYGMAFCAAGLSAPSPAASHRDWTVVPLGSFTLYGGEQSLQIARPCDRFGIIPTPIVLTVAFDPGQRQTQPIELRFAQGGRDWPSWTVEQIGQMYVIGLAALGPVTNAESGRVLTVQVTVQHAPAGLAVMASGTPDLKLAGDDALGPLDDVVRQLKPGTAREYLHAIAAINVGQMPLATAALARLAAGSDETVARFARAALRRVRFAEAEAAAEPTFAAHYRLGLYAQQCGQFRAARLHFDAALACLKPGQPRPADWFISDAWYRLGEMMERCGDPIADVADVLEKAGRAANVTPNVWDIWVVILRSKEYEETRAGEKVGVRVDMTPEQIARIKREWHWVEQMAYGASGGHLQLNTRYVEIPNTSGVPYGLNAGWLYGPLDALVPGRGSVDGVMSFHPRGPSVTGGADCGPNGAALTDIGTWCGWEVYLHEWNHQFDWTVRTAEAGDGYPITHHSDSCGHQPIPSMGYGHRASMRYCVTPAMYRRIEPADPDNGAGYVTNWRIGSPIAIDQTPPEKDLPPHHVLKFPPEKTRDTGGVSFVAEGDFQAFIDLKTFFAARGVKLPVWCVTPASTYVYSPVRQEVRLWLGHNDGMAVWLNDALIHRGDYYAIAKFEDQNWPNMVTIAGVLQAGWNRLEVVVESWPAPRDRGHGFSIRVCDFENRPVAGVTAEHAKLAVQPTILSDALRPAVGNFYRWDDVRDDYYRKLPKLTGRTLAVRAGLGPTFDVVGRIGATHGFAALGEREEAGSRPTVKLNDSGAAGALSPVPARWEPAQDHDTRLNNVLDWNREAVAIYPFAHSDPWEPRRYYLVLRPEAIDAYVTCLREPREARQVYGGRPMRDRILGYVQAGEPEGENEGARVLIVVEVRLPDTLPLDEEDLLTARDE